MMHGHELYMMHGHELYRAVALFALIALSAFGWGCGTTRTAALERAQAAYARAEGDPAIARTASVPLYEANQSLQKAEQARNEEEQQHYAYMAEKQTEQAVAQAGQKAAEQDLARLNQERQQMVLRSREQEAARARTEALTSQQQAQMAEQRAEEARRQEAQARGEARVAAEQERLAREQATQLESRMSELKARQTNSGNVVLTMEDVMFATNRATLTPGAMLSLDKLADILKQNPNEKVAVQGHTDSKGTAAFNRELSQQRAEAVKNALVQRGISPDRIIAQGFGESFPVVGNETETGRQQNRRVDIVVTG